MKVGLNVLITRRIEQHILDTQKKVFRGEFLACNFAEMQNSDIWSKSIVGVNVSMTLNPSRGTQRMGLASCVAFSENKKIFWTSL